MQFARIVEISANVENYKIFGISLGLWSLYFCRNTFCLTLKKQKQRKQNKNKRKKKEGKIGKKWRKKLMK